MDNSKGNFKEFIEAINIVKNKFLNHLKQKKSSIQIYTHLDADGLSAGAILGKALFRENIPFHITVLRQLEKQEIVKISKNVKNFSDFIFFKDCLIKNGMRMFICPYGNFKFYTHGIRAI